MITLTSAGSASPLAASTLDASPVLPPLTAGIAPTPAKPLPGPPDMRDGMAASLANPLETAFNEPWDEQQRALAKAAAARRGAYQQKLDAALLDPAAFFQANPLDTRFTADPEAEKKAVLNQAFIELHHGGPVPAGAFGYDLKRRELAHQLFDGRGADDSAAFHAELVKDAQGRKDETLQFSEIFKAASEHEIMAREDLGYGTAQDDENGFRKWRDANKGKPGFSRHSDADWLEIWAQAKQSQKERFEPVRQQVDQVWSSMVRKGDYGAEAEKAFIALPHDQRKPFLEMLAFRAGRLPEAEKATFWGNFWKSTKQGVGGLGSDLVDFVNRPGPVNATYGFGIGSQAYDTTAAEKGAQSARDKIDFRNAVIDVQEGLRDPLKLVAPNGLQWAEKVVYGTPGVFASSFSALTVPPLLFGSLTEGHYKSIRQNLIKDGTSETDAGQRAAVMAPLAAGLEFISEKLGSELLLGRLPLFEKALGGAIDKISSAPARFLSRSAAGGTEQGLQEVGQNYLDAIVQDLGHALGADVKDIQWLGKGGQFDGDWAENIDTFLAVLPLSLFGAVGGVSRDRRVKAFSRASDTELQSLGIPSAQIPPLREGIAQGMGSGNTAIDAALAGRDPNSPEAKAAVEELRRQHAQQAALAEAAQLSGAVPFFRTNPDKSISVLDGTTNEEIGTAATGEDAGRIAASHLALAEEAQAGFVSHMGTMLEAMQSRAKDGSGSDGHEVGFEYHPFKELSAKDKIAADPESIARVYAQLGITEAMSEPHRDKVLSGSFINGFSETEFRDGITRTTNTILGTGDIKTVFHEDTHGLRRAAMQRGTFSREEQVLSLRALDAAMAKQSGKHTAKRFLSEAKADADITETELDEAFSELMESEVLRRDVLGAGKNAGTAPGVVARYFDAAYSASPLAQKALHKLRGFVRYMRAMYGEVFTRAHHINKAIAKGDIAAGDYHAMLAKLTGTDEVAQADGQALVTAREIIDGTEQSTLADGTVVDTPLSITPLGAGAREITEAPAVVALSNPFSESDSQPSALRRYFWSNFTEITKDWPRIINTPEGSIGWSKSKTGDKLRAFKDGEPALLHFIAAANLPGLLENSKLAAVEPESKGDRTVQEVHRRYAWADFPNGERRHVLLTVERPSSMADENRQATDHAYSSEVLGVSIEILPKNESADVVNLKTGEDTASSSSQAVTSAQGETIRFLSGVKPGHRYAKPGPSFSISHGQQLDALIKKSLALMDDPALRLAVMGRIQGNMGKLSNEPGKLKMAFGKTYQERTLSDERSRKSLEKEAAFREAARRAELEDVAKARHEGILENPDLAKLKQQPVHEWLSIQGDPLHGRLMSPTQAIARGINFFDPAKQGDFDGADGVSRTVFGGTLMPDQAAQELYDRHLIKEPTPDAMWDALKREGSSVAKFRDYQAAARADLRAARLQAAEEARAWKHAATVEQGLDHSTHAKIVRAFGMLDGILYALPPELRGKIGLHTATLAKLKTDEARLAYLEKTIDKANEVIEKWMVREYGRMWEKLLDREKVKKNGPGKKPKGKAGADVHSLFATLRQAQEWTADAAEAEAVKLESLIATGNLTTEEEAHNTLSASLIRLVGDWKNADAARRAAAVKNATEVFENGYYNFQFKKLLEKEDRTIRRANLKKDTGKAGTGPERDAKVLSDNKLGGWAKQAALSFGSFEQVLHYAFGEKSAEARRLVDLERAASDKSTDAVFDKMDALEDLFTRIAGGGRLDGEKLRFDLSRKTLTIEGRQLSELEAMAATLMWRQADGRRHMEGTKDENGMFGAGEWHYGQAFVDACEAALSPAALEVRLHLSYNYAGEWATLNPVFRELNGIDLPYNANYSPITVKPMQAQSGQTVDPVTGAAVSLTSTTPGSLRSRGTSISEPDFRDALQTYIEHVKQIEHWKAYAAFSAEAGAVIGNRSLGNSIEAAGGKEAVKVLRSMLDIFAMGGPRDAGTHLEINKVLRGMSTRAAVTALVGRASVLAIQSVQLCAAIAEMPLGSYVKRLGGLLTGNMGWAAAFNSPYIQRRMRQLPPAVRQAMEGLQSSKPNSLKHHIARIGTLIGGADALFTAGTYAMVYDYQLMLARKEGMTGADAEAYAHTAAERSVDRIAQPTRAGTRSLYENLSTNPIGKISWAFASEPRQKLALAFFTLANPRASAGRKARAIAVTWLVGGMVTSLIRSAWRDARDDDDDEWFDDKNWGAKRLALSTVTGPLRGIPIIGDMAEGGLYKAFGEYLPQGNLFSSTGQGVQAVKHVPDWITGEREVYAAIKDAEAILSAMGVFNETLSAAASVSHLARDIYGLTENATK